MPPDGHMQSDESVAVIEAWLTEQRDTFDRWTPQRDTINLLLRRLQGETFDDVRRDLGLPPIGGAE